MKIECLELPPIGTNAWLLTDSQRGEAALIDAPLEAFESVTERLESAGMRLTAVLMTHGHWDHLLDGWRFNEAGIPTFGHRADEPLFSEPNRMGRFAIGGIEMKPMRIDRWLVDGERFEVLGRSVEARHVPGHCAGSLLFWFPEEGVAFSGDAVFQRSIGRTDLPGGDFSTLENAIRSRIYSLPGATVLCPGHGPQTTVDEEIENNPFVRPV